MRAGLTERACLGCSARTTTPDQMCRSCTHTYYSNTTITDAHGLTGGRWMLDGLTRVWVEIDEPPTPRASVHYLIACPTCHARVDETCRTRSGRRTTPHDSRLAPRLCPCGSTIDTQRRMCDTCRDESLQAAKNEHGRRRKGKVA